MKRLFYGISLIGILLSFPILLIGQILDQELYSYDCIDEEDNAFVDTYIGVFMKVEMEQVIHRMVK